MPDVTAKAWRAFEIFAMWCSRCERVGFPDRAGNDLYGGSNRLIGYLKEHGGITTHHVDTTNPELPDVTAKAWRAFEIFAMWCSRCERVGFPDRE
jgi:predicted MarR family transcription regulator